MKPPTNLFSFQWDDILHKEIGSRIEKVAGNNNVCRADSDKNTQQLWLHRLFQHDPEVLPIASCVANAFPDPLMLNTDGNVKVVSGIDAPVIPIKDEVTVEGRLTKRKLAYKVFLDAVAELEKKQNDFKTIVVDLLEDVYDGCRVFICERQGWKHESDDSFRAWDMVRSEFLNTLKWLVNLDYENIVLISHEDRTRDLTRKSGDKISSIKPNLQDKVANKVAGMVDLVARIVADDDERVLSFKVSEVIFGGGRLTVHNKEIPLDYAAFCDVYTEAAEKAAHKAADVPQTPGNKIYTTPGRNA